MRRATRFVWALIYGTKVQELGKKKPASTIPRPSLENVCNGSGA